MKVEIIAEIGQNHNGDTALALELIRAAKANGADVAKFQLYEARRLFPKENNEWFEYNCKTELKKDQVYKLSEACREVGIEFMVSVFDVERVGWAEEVGVRRYKIASRSIHDRELIRAIERTGKPILASLGMWSNTVLPTFKTRSPVDFLYCISKYPAELSDLHFRQVDFERNYSGFSDHTMGIAAGLVAFSRGARILEKHFTLDKTMHGPDHICSMVPSELKQLSDFRSDIERCL